MKESLYRFQNLDYRSPNMNSIGAQFCVGHPTSFPAYMEPYFYEVSPNGPSPTFAQLSPSQPEKQPPMGTIGKNEGHENLTLSINQKRFLVFDQSGDQTTLLISSGFGAPVPPLNSWLKGDGPVAKGVSVSPLDPLLEDEHQNDGVENEDTEELNALLYSDDDYSEDDEETSTGHSPNEEVASSGPTKRTKLLDGGYGTPSVIMKAEFLDTASSLKRASHPSPDEFRKENIRDTIRILREIIPDGQGKDSIDIIDEAIDYLKSLKAKAKDWGLDGR